MLDHRTALQYIEWSGVGIDEIPRPVIGAGPNRMANGARFPEHSHRKGELVYTVSGVLTCAVEDCLWSVAPRSAVWMPAGTVHSCQAFGEAVYYVLFIDHDASEHLPKTCCTMSVSPLFREAIMRVATFPALFPPDSAQSRLLPVIYDEIANAKTDDHRLPLPHDQGLRRLFEMLIAAPADKSSAATWAERCAMSERTLSRKVRQHTGMTLWRWRHQLHVTLALQRLATGGTVQDVAWELGYETPSSFITMFKKTVGKSPARYLADRDIDAVTP